MRIDRTGIQPTSLTEYVALLERVFRDSLGQTLNLASETPQGQLIGLDALARAQADEVAVAVANGMSLNLATGTQLDAIGSILLLPRIVGERSIVTVTLTGDPGTTIPTGSRTRTDDDAVFVLDSKVIIPASRSVTATMRSEELGPIPAPAGTLTQMVEAITGWTGVTNPADAQLGRNAETDREYRRRYPMEVAHNGRDGLEHMRARILRVEGVADARVVDNTTNDDITVQGTVINARCILTVVQGGADADIARAILDTKPAGVGTCGAVQRTVKHAQGMGTAVRFGRITLDSIALNISIRTRMDFPPDGITLIKQRCAAWVAGDYTAIEGRFETSGLGIGERLDVQRLLTPIQSVPGHEVVSYAVTLKEGGGEVSDNTDTLEYVYQVTATNVAPTTPTGGAATDNFVPAGWSASPPAPTAAMPYVWRSTRTQTGGAWADDDFATPALWSAIALPDPPLLTHRFTLSAEDVTVSLTL